MTRIAYVDAIGGLAGDMLLGALLDAGASEERVRAGLAPLGVGLRVEPAARHHIAARRVTVTAGGEDVAGGAPPVTLEADGAGAHRRPAEVRALIDRAGLPARPRGRALAVFAALARAEGRVHGIEPEEVRFHEVGALDAIGDVCGIALALEDLGVDELACSPVPCPRGFVDAAHGRLPVPGPATLELLRGAVLQGVDLDVELVTPTGAAVVAALAVEHGPLPALRLEAAGYGAGARDLSERPNLVRVVIGERAAGDGGAEERVSLVETNLDDLSPELVPDAAERCFAAGALDVWVTPAQMKKGRPGVVLAALARPADERAVSEAILRETSTLGVRISSVRRRELAREWRTVDVGGHPVRVKLGRLGGDVVNVAPEHDDCAAAARATGRPVKAVWAAALAAAEAQR